MSFVFTRKSEEPECRKGRVFVNQPSYRTSIPMPGSEILTSKLNRPSSSNSNASLTGRIQFGNGQPRKLPRMTGKQRRVSSWSRSISKIKGPKRSLMRPFSSLSRSDNTERNVLPPKSRSQVSALPWRSILTETGTFSAIGGNPMRLQIREPRREGPRETLAFPVQLCVSKTE